MYGLRPLSRRLARLAAVVGFCGVLAVALLGPAPARAEIAADPILGQTDMFNVYDWGADRIFTWRRRSCTSATTW